MKMKMCFTVIAAATLLAGCHSGQVKNTPSRTTASTEGIAKVIEFFNSGDAQAAHGATNATRLEGDRIISPRGVTRAPNQMEDCRQVGIRQAILDASQSGMTFGDMSRSTSHRLKHLDDSGFDGDSHIGLMVGFRPANQAHVTFRYELTDPSNGACSLVRTTPPMPNTMNRRSAEQMYEREIFPRLPQAEQQRLREMYKGDAAKVAKESVGKLFESECEQDSINKAALAAQKFFVDTYRSQPIMLIDYGKSVVRWNEGGGYNRVDGDRFAGNWVFMMADATATNMAVVDVAFTAVERKESCEGTYQTPVVR